MGRGGRYSLISFIFALSLEILKKFVLSESNYCSFSGLGALNLLEGGTNPIPSKCLAHIFI